MQGIYAMLQFYSQIWVYFVYVYTVEIECCTKLNYLSLILSLLIIILLFLIIIIVIISINLFTFGCNIINSLNPRHRGSDNFTDMIIISILCIISVSLPWIPFCIVVILITILALTTKSLYSEFSFIYLVKWSLED